MGPDGILLDETAVTVWGGRVVANCRLQGFEGRGAGARYLAWGDGRRWAGGRVWQVEDPGCNACARGDVFVHPHERDARAGGMLVRLSAPWEGPIRTRRLVSMGPGPFGYSDISGRGDEVVVVFERDRGLWEASFLPGR